jgi:hypothetical protein
MSSEFAEEWRSLSRISHSCFIWPVIEQPYGGVVALDGITRREGKGKRTSVLRTGNVWAVSSFSGLCTLRPATDVDCRYLCCTCNVFTERMYKS